MSGSRLDQPIEFKESRKDAEAMFVDLGYSRNGLSSALPPGMLRYSRPIAMSRLLFRIAS